MKRLEFIKTCGFACIGALTAASIIDSCKVAKDVNGTISGSDLVVPLSSFESGAEGDKKTHRYTIARHDSLLYPICVYRHDDSSYSALLMKCPHQGAEVQVFGDRLQCPAHGSEFLNNGVVQNGPAQENLRSFPVRLDNKNLYISLK